MAELLDDVSYLSQEIGPRPAGTEEEQQAALYIADKVHERTGFHAEIEDIRCMAYSELVDCIYFGAATVLLALAFFLPVTSIVTFILSAAVAVLYVVERVQKRPILGRFLTRDISQNVVVKYKPGTTAAQSGHPRKIVVVANYDSGRVRRDATPRLVGLTAFVTRAASVSLVASPVLILLRNIVFAGSLGVINALFTLLCVVALLFMVAQLAILLVHRLATFNEAANNNASSIAVMLEVLRRIDGTAAPENAPRTRDVAASEKPVVHGEAEAKAAGVVPEGAQLSYDDDAAVADDAQEAEPAEQPMEASAEAPEPQPAVEEDSAAARLRSAKAAIAALTGEAIDDAIFLDLDEKRAAAAASATQAASFLDRLESEADEAEQQPVDIDAAIEEPQDQPMVEEAAQPQLAQEPAAPEIPADPSVPAWYLAAQAKANRPVDMPVRRSRYADDADAIAHERQQRQQRAAALVDEETEERLRQMRESFAATSELPKEEPEAQEELVVEAVQDELQPAVPEPSSVAEPAAVEEDLEVTASFPPVGGKGETVEFEPESELEDDFEPEPVPQPVQPEDDIIEVDDYEEVIEVPLELIEEDDEYDDYYDDEEAGDGYEAYDEAEDLDEPEEGARGFLGRFGIGRAKSEEGEDAPKEGLFARLRNAVMPETGEEEYIEDEYAEDEYRDGEYTEEPAEARQPLAEEPAAEPAAEDWGEPAEAADEPADEYATEAERVEAEPYVPQEGEDLDDGYYDEEYDDEPSRFESLRDRMSGAFSRLTSRIAPPPNFDEQDYSYEEEEEEGYGAQPYSQDEPMAGEYAEAEEPVAASDGVYGAEPEAVPAEDYLEPAPAFEEPVAPQDYHDDYAAAPEEPVASPEPFAGYADEQDDGYEPVQPEAGFAEEPQPAEDSMPLYDQPEEAAADGYEGGEYEDEGYEAPSAYEPQETYADVEDEEGYDDWEDEEQDRPGFFERVSGFWNRLVGRRDEEEGDDYYEDYAEDGYEDADAGYSEQPAAEEAAPAPMPAQELTYQTAYAPRRVAPKSYGAVEQEAAPEPVAADVPEDELGFEPADEAEVYEPVADAPVEQPVFEPEAPEAYDQEPEYDEPAEQASEPFVPMADPDMAYQQVMVQPGNEDREIPVAIPAERPTANRSRSANPRVGLRQRVAEAMSAWEEPATPEATAPFNPVSPDMTAPFDPAPADLYDDDLDVEPVANPELDAQANIMELPIDESALGGTIAMPPIDVSELQGATGETVEEPVFEEVADADLLEPAYEQRVQMPEIPLQVQQNAPLAQDERKVAQSRLSSTIPSIDIPKPQPDPADVAADESNPSHTERMRRLRADLPSMSGRIGGMQAGDGSGIVSTTGSFAAVSATGNIDPVGDELIEELPPEEIYVDDADDSVYGGVAEAGAYIAADYVRMPEKRRGLFGRRKRRDENDDLTPQQWLGVSDDFDAREVGKARGDWTSFQENDARSTVGDRYEEGQQDMWRSDRNAPSGAGSDYDTGLDSAFNDEEDDFLDDDYGMNNGRWNGGAFSGRRAGGRTTERDRYDAYEEMYDYGGYGPSGGDEYAEFAEYADENYDENAFLSELEYEDSMEADNRGGRLKSITARFSRKDREGGDEDEGRRSSRSGREHRSMPSEDDAWNVAAARAAARSAVANVIDDPRVQEELGDTYGFVDDAISNEVWFVALGAGGSDNAGMEAFLDAHGDELRGAMVINLEGIGDGNLVGMASEGLLKKYKPTTRMKRFLRNAGQATGVRVGQAEMNWRDSPATVAMRRGMPTITVAGADGDVPVRYASSDDVADKLDEGTLKQRVNFILELLRTI